MMHVLIIPSWYTTKENPLGGIFFKEQAQALHNSGLKVTLAFPEIVDLEIAEKSSYRFPKIKIANEDNVNTYRTMDFNKYSHLLHGSRFSFLEMAESLFLKIAENEGKPDIIHAHSILLGGWVGSKLSKKYGVPLVITEHSSAYTQGMIRETQKPLIKEALKISKKNIVVGPSLEKAILEYTNQKNKIKLIPNLVNISRFNIPNKHISNHGKKFSFFTLAILTSLKGIDILIQAFFGVFKNNPFVELIIGGDGVERSNLENLVNSLDLNSQVTFLGKLTRENVVKEMQNCDVFVLPSRSETFGVVYIEALACGKPIIATRCGGPESIVNDRNGLLVETEDKQDLASAMKFMYENIENYNSAIIRQDCLNRFSEEIVVMQIIDIYKDILKN